MMGDEPWLGLREKIKDSRVLANAGVTNVEENSVSFAYCMVTSCSVALKTHTSC